MRRTSLISEIVITDDSYLILMTHQNCLGFLASPEGPLGVSVVPCRDTPQFVTRLSCCPWTFLVPAHARAVPAAVSVFGVVSSVLRAALALTPWA